MSISAITARRGPRQRELGEGEEKFCKRGRGGRKKEKKRKWGARGLWEKMEQKKTRKRGGRAKKRLLQGDRDARRRGKMKETGCKRGTITRCTGEKKSLTCNTRPGRKPSGISTKIIKDKRAGRGQGLERRSRNRPMVMSNSQRKKQL